MRLVLVKWIDSIRHPDGWQPVEHYAREADRSLECETVGWVVHEKDDSLMVAQSRMVEGTAVTEVIQIPSIAVVKVHDLGATKKKGAA